MLLQGTVFDPSGANTADGSIASANLGRANELLVAELHGKYFTQNYRGNVFIGSTSTTGVTIPIATTKTPVYTIWNPAGSGKLCVPLVSLISYNATTGVLGGLVWMATTSAGASIATTGPFVTFTTPATPISANLGAGKTSQMKFGNDTTTMSITAAATFYRALGITVFAHTAAGDQGLLTNRDDWDGTGIIPPGNAIHLMGSTAVALAALVTTVWAEIPL